jgi:pimeloyl-ACP methyl ester carboxylesterase
MKQRLPFTDVLVVVPGIMGSSLLGRDGQDIWGTRRTTLARGLVTLARAVGQLRLPDGIGDDHPGDGVRPGALIPDLHVIPGLWTIDIGYERLLRHLRATYDLVEPNSTGRPANFLPFAYDWRLSNRYNARQLKQTVEPVLERWRAAGHHDARQVLICHSMGGLIARWYLDREDGAALTKTLITIGTPHRGAAKAVGQLVNGVRPSLGPIAHRLTTVARSLPSIYQLLPAYRCVDHDRVLRPIIENPLPNMDTAMTADGLRFHEQLDEAHGAATPYHSHPIVGINQPTFATVRLVNGHAVLLRTIEGDDEKGDGTVPRFAARPTAVAGRSPTLHYVTETHTTLPANQAVIDQIDGILTATDVERRAPAVELGVSVDDVTISGEPVDVAVETSDSRVLVEARLLRDGHTISSVRMRNDGDGRLRASFADVSPGGYAIVIGRLHPSGRLVDTVTGATLVIDPSILNEARAPLR